MPEAYSIIEVARIMKIMPYTVRKLAREDNTKRFFKIGREWRIMQEDLNNWVQELKEKSTIQAGN